MSDIQKTLKFVMTAHDAFCDAVGDEGETTVGGRRIKYKVRGYFYRWELHFEAEVVDVETGVRGKAKKLKSKNNALDTAVQDLFSNLEGMSLLLLF